MSKVHIPVTILRLRSVTSRTGLSKSSIYAMVRLGKFPAQVSLGAGARAVGWVESHVDQWLENLTVKTVRDELQQSDIRMVLGPIKVDGHTMMGVCMRMAS